MAIKLVVKEIEKIMGKAPKRIFIEMAREKRESKRTDSRKKTLIELYKKCREEERDWISELNHTEDSSLRGDKLYRRVATRFASHLNIRK